MIKTLRIIFLIVIIFPMLAFTAESSSDNTEDILERINENVSSGLENAADDDTKQAVGELDLDVSKPESFSEISLPKILRGILKRFLYELGKPAAMLGKLIAVILLCSLAQNVSVDDGDVTALYKTVSILVGVLAIYDCINESINVIVSALERLTSFMLAYIPIYASVTAATGNYSAAASFYGSNLFLCECTAAIARKALLPLLSVLTAISVAAAVNKDIKLGNAASAVRTVIRWCLGITMTLFCGLLTIQTTVGSAADTVRTRTVRFAASSFIPIIGTAVSESYSTIKGSLHVIKSGSGAIGIVLIAATVLYPIIAILAVRAVLAAGKFISDVFCQQDMSDMLGNMNDILSIGMSILVCISVMFIISTAIIMLAVVNSGA